MNKIYISVLIMFSMVLVAPGFAADIENQTFTLASGLTNTNYHKSVAVSSKTGAVVFVWVNVNETNTARSIKMAFAKQVNGIYKAGPGRI